MTKKIIVLFLLLTFIVLLCSCEELDESFQDLSRPDYDYFEIIDISGDAYLFVDVRTGCQYLRSYDCGLVLVVDAEGNPLIYDGELGGERK